MDPAQDTPATQLAAALARALQVTCRDAAVTGMRETFRSRFGKPVSSFKCVTVHTRISLPISSSYFIRRRAAPGANRTTDPATGAAAAVRDAATARDAAGEASGESPDTADTAAETDRPLPAAPAAGRADAGGHQRGEQQQGGVGVGGGAMDVDSDTDTAASSQDASAGEAMSEGASCEGASCPGVEPPQLAAPSLEQPSGTASVVWDPSAPCLLDMDD